MCTAVVIVEVLVCVKFGQGMFPKAHPTGLFILGVYVDLSQRLLFLGLFLLLQLLSGPLFTLDGTNQQRMQKRRRKRIKYVCDIK